MRNGLPDRLERLANDVLANNTLPPNLLQMNMQTVVTDTFSLTGDHVASLQDVLRSARHIARIVRPGASPWIEDALVELKGDLTNRLAQEDNPAAAERERRAWRPLRAA
jgi:hypothetical protein